MADYQRFLSYIYSYQNGIKDKNVGFAKVEVRGSQCKIQISIKGVYTQIPRTFGVYMLVDRDEQVEGKFSLIQLSDILLKSGMGQAQLLLNADNINGAGYAINDVCGISIADPDDYECMMFTMWKDYDVNPEAVTFVRDVPELKNAPEREYISRSEKKSESVEVLKSENKSELADVPNSERTTETADASKSERRAELADVSKIDTISKDIKEKEFVSSSGMSQEEKTIDNSTDEDLLGANTFYKNDAGKKKDTNISKRDVEYRRALGNSIIEKLFKEADKVDAFEDDYLYDCIDVTPEMLKKAEVLDDDSGSNSFLLHGYYNFRHILFGRVSENANNTHYFIGIPGMYCNRERFMASMFGFNNFRKSHRSDFSNPYFGYWYKEI